MTTVTRMANPGCLTLETVVTVSTFEAHKAQHAAWKQWEPFCCAFGKKQGVLCPNSEQTRVNGTTMYNKYQQHKPAN